MLGLMILVKDVLDQYGETSKGVGKKVDVLRFRNGVSAPGFYIRWGGEGRRVGMMKVADRINEIS